MLRARMVEVFPQLHGAPISHTWTGKLGLTFDLMPHIGRARPLHRAARLTVPSGTRTAMQVTVWPSPANWGAKWAP